jgi:hypothetical protein
MSDQTIVIDGKNYTVSHFMVGGYEQDVMTDDKGQTMFITNLRLNGFGIFGSVAMWLKFREAIATPEQKREMDEFKKRIIPGYGYV